MFIKFDNEIYWVRGCYTLTSPTSTTSTNSKSKKRKQMDSDRIYVIRDCTYTSAGDIAVKASDCEEISSIDSSFEEVLDEFLEEYFSSSDDKKYLKCSYETNRKKSYYISSIDKIMDDGMIVSLHDGEIRHFKFDKLYIGCGDGLKEDCW